MIKVDSPDKCCGCGACFASCHHNAISIYFDSEGFSYPKIDKALCVNCGLCDTVCPVLHQQDSVISSAVAMCGKSKETSVQINSASGGIFPIIARSLLNSNGYVLGASFNIEWNVEHIVIDNIGDLDKLCRSKYVQSINDNTFKTVKKLLKANKKVLYTGTPCQSSALKNYLGKDYDNLFIIDVVCHGVPSPKIWRKYLVELSESMNEKVSNISEICFKYKDIACVYNWTHPGFLVRWNSGKEYLTFSNQTPYETGFLCNLFVRPSCHKCKYKKLNSGSDLTIGDFWGCDKIFPEIYDPKGVSVIITNTNKGFQLLKSVQSEILLKEITIEQAISYNRRITTSSVPHIHRKYFFSNVDSIKISDLIHYSLQISIYEKFVSKFKLRIKKIYNNILQKK